MAVSSISLVAGDEPEAGGDLGGVEELAGQGKHTVDQVGLDQGFADLALARLLGGHGAFGKNEPGHAVWGKVVDEVLHPGVVCVGGGGKAVLPQFVLKTDGRRAVILFCHVVCL